MPPLPTVKHFDYLVLGGGSGGIASARRAAEFGVKVREERAAWGDLNISVKIVISRLV